MSDEVMVIGARARARVLRGDDGHTLVELLAAMAIASGLLTALMFVFVNGLNGAVRVSDRSEATTRARVALERMITVLDSQVCLTVRTTNADGSTSDDLVAPVLPGSTDTSVSFYADLSGASDAPDEYAYTYDPAAHTITELRYGGSGAMPDRTYPAQPSVRRLLADDVVAARGTDGATLPVFRYYAFEADGTVDTTKPLSVPLSAADAARVVRVGVALQADSARTHRDDPRRTVLESEATLATASPSDGSTCA